MDLITDSFDPLKNISSRYSVYVGTVDPANDNIIIGKKSKTSMEPGYIYAPYIEMVNTPKINRIEYSRQQIYLQKKIQELDY